MRMLLFLIAFIPWLSAGAFAEPEDAARSAGVFVLPEETLPSAASITRPEAATLLGAAISSRRAPQSATEVRVLALYGDREFPTISLLPTGAGAFRETGAISRPLHRQTEDSWFGFDKVQHLSFSFLWTLGTQYVVVNKVRLSEAQALPISISTSAALGLSKEVYDLHRGPQGLFSYRDLVADSVGILLAVGLILL